MAVFVTSSNLKKLEVVQTRFSNCQLIDVPSGVSPLPFNDEIIQGVINRNKEGRKMVSKESLLVSFETGIFKKEDGYWVGTACLISTGFCQSQIEISSLVKIPKEWDFDLSWNFEKAMNFLTLNYPNQDIISAITNKEKTRSYFFLEVFNKTLKTL